MPRQPLPDIDERRCTSCGDCIRTCPTNCLSQQEGFRIVVAPALCIGCDVCRLVCPVEAIAMAVQEW